MMPIMWMGMMALPTSIYNPVHQRGKDELSLQGSHQAQYDMKLWVTRQPRQSEARRLESLVLHRPQLTSRKSFFTR